MMAFASPLLCRETTGNPPVEKIPFQKMWLSSVEAFAMGETSPRIGSSLSETLLRKNERTEAKKKKMTQNNKIDWDNINKTKKTTTS